ncbi:hypothetical protein HHK36_007504 [Tetracentron sinense]|uniref:CCT domain-containing protein n=1 Tax=Tetracentron sinense TaxID=13715 RepID=A0A834ZMR4_TETSI|nr:hypothetical protein HHK36_007504 [Tetracentron sinense]
MCNKNIRSDSMNNIQTSPLPKPRKPMFLSLLQEVSPESGEMTHQNQLNLFPLHPENLFEEKDIHDENVAYFFHADGGANLNGLLGGEGEGEGEGEGGSVLSSQENSLSQSLTYAYGRQESEECASSLARTALRQKERDSSEEKWVNYSEVLVEKKEEEVSSCSADVGYQNQNQREGLLLKLDYEEILNAWSDKGPLYIQGERPQIVPDIHDDYQAQDSPSVWVDDGCAGNGGLWRVPDEGSRVIEEGWKTGEREARVMRYKEKRLSRLFSKKIRYEIRKLNAQKRPRMKGRFVKRS